MMILPTPLVGPTKPLCHTDQVNQSPSKPHDPDSRHHASLQNRFSHLADLSDDGLNSAREESTSLTQITSLASTSANTKEHMDMPHPHDCTVTCTQPHISKPKDPTLLHSSSSHKFNTSENHHAKPSTSHTPSTPTPHHLHLPTIPRLPTPTPSTPMHNRFILQS